MDTPPGTTLSTPSPTELHDKDPLLAEADKVEMIRANAIHQLKPIYLVVATTPCKTTSSTGACVHKLGIGLNGQLPWPMVKGDMSYFKNVTEKGASGSSQSHNHDGAVNNVIMGRKTYFSIPQKFRPLAHRTNIIITRSPTAELAKQIVADLEDQQAQARDWSSNKFKKPWDQAQQQTSMLDRSSLEGRKFMLGLTQFSVTNSGSSGSQIKSNNGSTSDILVHRNPQTAIDSVASSKGELFCIGGAEIYNAFLQDKQLRPRLRILQTEIEKVDDSQKFPCDTFWPEDLTEASGWEEVTSAMITSWTGIAVPQGDAEWHNDEKVGVRLRVRGWKHADTKDEIL